MESATCSRYRFSRPVLTDLQGYCVPAQHVSVPVYFQSGTPADPYGFQLGVVTADNQDPIDWNAVQSQWLAPTDASRADWSDVFLQLQHQLGTTSGDFVRAMAGDASLIPAGMGNSQSISDLLRLEILKASAAVTTSITGRLHAANASISLANRTVAAHDLVTGDVYVATSLNDGTFIFDQLEPGAYKFTVDDLQVSAGDQAVAVSGVASSGLVVEVSRGAQLSGQVVAQESGAGLPFAEVRATAADGSQYAATTDSHGRFVLSGLPPSTYKVVADATDRARTSLTGIVVAANDQLNETLALPAQGTITGVLAFPGVPAVQVTIVASDANAPNPSLSFTLTPSNLLFDIDRLPSGLYDLTIYATGYATKTIDGVHVSNGVATDVGVISMSLGASVEGILISDDPQYQTAFAPIGAFQGTAMVAVATTDASGDFTFADLAPGDYSFRPIDATGFVTTATLSLASGNEMSGATIRVEPGGAIVGTATDALSGQPLTGATVVLDDSTGQILRTTTDSAGAYRFDRLANGNYVVHLLIGGSAGSRAVTVSDPTGAEITANLQYSAVADHWPFADRSGQPGG